MKLLLLLHNSCWFIFGSTLDAAIPSVQCKCGLKFFLQLPDKP